LAPGATRSAAWRRCSPGGAIDDKGSQASVNQIRGIDLHTSRILDSLHVPEGEGERL
jgi:hypothetical protein